MSDDLGEVEQLLLHFIEHPSEESDSFRREGDYKNRHWDMVRALKGVSSMALLPDRATLQFPSCKKSCDRVASS